jgi:hypothetical protein
VVNVVLGEMRGEGVKVAARCFWDADSDNLAQDTYINVEIAYVGYTVLCGLCIRDLLLLSKLIPLIIYILSIKLEVKLASSWETVETLKSLETMKTLERVMALLLSVRILHQ